MLAIFAFLPFNGWAAEIKSVVGKDGRAAVLITGDIVPGDADTFINAVKQANDAGKFVANVRLNSAGGNVLEGVKIVDAVRFGKVSTNVGKKAVCASACFLIFAAGSTKFASYGAQIGVHGASDVSGAETVQSNAATVSMAKVAKDIGVPAAIIGRMVVTPPSEMVWLDPADLQSMGVTMVGKPDQTTPPVQDSTVARQTPPGAPMPLHEDTKASGPVTWQTLTEKAFELSSQQNGGSPKIMRSCQPRQGVCTSAIKFKMDGKDTVVLRRENINGRTVEREICTYNDFGDMRNCVDWDTNATHRDMKDSQGEWSKVSD